jgi:hypothetical protein
MILSYLSRISGPTVPRSAVKAAADWAAVDWLNSFRFVRRLRCWSDWPFKHPDCIRIAVATAREWLTFKDRTLCVMAFWTVDTGCAIDLASLRWRLRHDDWDSIRLFQGSLSCYDTPITIAICLGIPLTCVKSVYMAGSDEHLKPLRLFDIARYQGGEPTEREKEHLRTCENCLRTLETFSRQFAKPPSMRENEGC